MTRQKDIRRDSFKDSPDRDNYETLQEISDIVLRTDNPFINFQGSVYSREFTAAGTFEVAHGLGFKPTDFFLTGNSNNVTVTLGLVTKEVATITISAATALRFILGRF